MVSLSASGQNGDVRFVIWRISHCVLWSANYGSVLIFFLVLSFVMTGVSISNERSRVGEMLLSCTFNAGGSCCVIGFLILT